MVPLISDLLTSGAPAQIVAGVLLLGGGAAFALCGIALSLIDLQQHRLPNRIVYPWTGGTAALLALVTFLLGDGPGLGRALIAGLLWGAVFLAIRLLHPPSMGMGDVKLVVVLGLYAGYLGWQTLAGAVVLSFLLGGLVSISLLMTGRVQRSTRVPFGPFLIAGTAAALVFV